MSRESIEKQLAACTSLAAKEAWVRAHAPVADGGKVFRTDLDRLRELIKARRRREAAAVLLALAISAGGNAVIAQLRRHSLLRASRYGFESGTLRELVRLLGRLHDALNLEPRWVAYLASVDSLLELAPEAKRMRDGLVAGLLRRRGKALKSFLALANHGFVNGGLPHDDPEHSPSGRISAEDIAGAVSRVIALAKEEGRLHIADFAYTDEQALNTRNGSYPHDLLTALRLEKLYEAETLIDGLPYCARAAGDEVVVASIDSDVEKSVRLGYVQTTNQMRVRLSEMEAFWATSARTPMSLGDVFKRYYDDVISEFAEIKTFPKRRITFGIPAIPNLFDPLASDNLFREDIFALLQLDVHSYEELEPEPFEVAPGVDSIDLFKVNRLFALIAYVFQRKLETIEAPEERLHLAFHSVIAVMKKEALLGLLGVVLSREKAERVEQLLVLDESSDLIDLQYSPFLKVDDYYLLAPSLIAQSNLVRNIAFPNGLNADRLDGEDPMQMSVANALRSACFLVGEQVEDSKSSRTGDTDLVAYRDGILYLLECKNSYHPCNAHEMRNSYEHIRKAGQQLTLRAQKFGEPAYRQKIWTKLGWTVPAPTAIRTAVLMADRVFHGSSIEGHPVRQGHEFINVVTRGVITSPDTVHRFWASDTLTTADLDCYLDGLGLLEEQFASMDPVQYRYAFGAKKLLLESWQFDPAKQHEIVGRRYAATARNAS